MSATKNPFRVPAKRSGEQGVAAVEFALVAMIFFLVFFGIVEIARAMYLCNTLQEVTRRAAAFAVNTDFTDGNAMQQVRAKAVFRTSAGFLMFGQPVTDAYVKIDYLQVRRDGANLTMVPIPAASLPASPAANYLNCLNDPNSTNPAGKVCIRLVRARVCQPGGSDDCAPVRYQTLVSLIALPFNLPFSTTIANAETLGKPESLPPEPCGCI